MNTAYDEQRVYPKQAVKWRTFGLLLVLSLITSLFIIPYSTTLTSLGNNVPGPILPLVVVTIISTFVFSSIAIAIGLWLGEQIGLGAPIIQAWMAGDPHALRRFRTELPIAMGLGFVTGVVLILLGAVVKPLLPTFQPTITHPPVWQGLLATISAAVNEEVRLRLGLMTLIAWGLTRIVGGKYVGQGAGWTSIILAALVFGALHLPLASTLMGLSLPVVVSVLVGNGLAGISFGWLYWRRSLLAAMIAHFTTDIILHVLAPILSSISYRP